MTDFKRGMRFDNDHLSYRIIYVNQELMTICDLKSSRLNIFYISKSDFSEKIMKEHMHIVQEPVYVIDINALPEKERIHYQQRRTAMDMVDDVFGPDYIGLVGQTNRSQKKAIMSACQISKASFSRWTCKYIKSGLKNSSLVDRVIIHGRTNNQNERNITHGGGRSKNDGTRPYKITKDDEDLMMKYVKIYKRARSSEITLSTIYQNFQDEYRDAYGNLPRSYPSQRQFEWFAMKNISEAEKIKKMTSPEEMRNNNRPLISSADADVNAPMEMCEVDAHEMDVEIVNGNRDKVAGRAIIYAMIDTLTRMIVGVGVAFDNNSQIGFNRLFECLIDDKAEVFKRHPELGYYAWPNMCFPMKLRCDNGSDFISKETERIANALNITIMPTTAATGSLKGIVERFFREQENRLDVVLSGNGLIKKTHDSNHKKKAKLTIDEIRYMIEELVIYQNTNIQEGIRLTRKMIEDGVRQIPCEVWRYYSEKLHEVPKPITDVDAFRLALYIPKTGSITQRGIRHDNIFYISMTDKNLISEMTIASKKKPKKIELLTNPASIDYLFYRINEKDPWKMALINDNLPDQLSLKGMTQVEYAEYRKKKNQMRREDIQKRRDARSKMDRTNREIVKTAEKMQNGTPDSKNMKDTNREEKYKEQKKLAKKNILADIQFAQNNEEEHNSIKNSALQNPDIFDAEYTVTDKSNVSDSNNLNGESEKNNKEETLEEKRKRLLRSLR